MKILLSKLSMGQLYTRNTSDDDNDDNDNDNDTRWTNHDCIGSLSCMPNEPKIRCVRVKKIRTDTLSPFPRLFKRLPTQGILTRRET